MNSTALEKAPERETVFMVKILTWSEEVWVCEGAGLAQVSIWNPPVWDGLEGVPSLRTGYAS